jgi:hypothetical protein
MCPVSPLPIFPSSIIATYLPALDRIYAGVTAIGCLEITIQQ